MKNMRYLDLVGWLAGLTIFFMMGVLTGVVHAQTTYEQEARARDAKLRTDLTASCVSDAGTCPTYEQLRDQHLCRRCLAECYPLVGDGGRP